MLFRAARRPLARAARARFAGGVALEEGLPPERRREAVIKICSILGQRYLDFNDDIPTTADVKLIDDETGNFLGVYGAVRAQELARKEGKDLVMFNAAVSPKICKLVYHRRGIYERFLREVVAKELQASERVRARQGQAIRRLELSPRISLNDMTGKLYRLYAACARSAQGICVLVEVVNGAVDDARAVLQRAGRVLQGRAFSSERPRLVDDRNRPVDEDALAPRAPVEDDEPDAPAARVFAAQTFHFDLSRKQPKDDLDELEFSESQLFEIADEVFEKRGVPATSLEQRLENFALESETVAEQGEKQRIEVPWLEKLLARDAAEPEGLLEEALRGVPELNANVRAELARLNLPVTEANLSAQVRRLADRRSSTLNDLQRLFGFNGRGN